MIAYVGGTFDCLHAGHINLLYEIYRKGFEVYAIVNSDSFVDEYRGTRCLYNENERLQLITELPFVSNSFIVDKDDQKDLISYIQPDVIVVGTDWMKPEILPQLGIDEEFLRENNIAMMFLPRTKGISTTDIKRRCTLQ